MAPVRLVITGGPAAGKASVIALLQRKGQICSRADVGKDTYRSFYRNLGRHLEAADRADYCVAVLRALTAEYEAHTQGLRFFNRGIPDCIGWARFFGLAPSEGLMKVAAASHRYDGVLLLDPLDRFLDDADQVWPSENEARRAHDLISQGYMEAGYRPICVPVDSPEGRLRFIEANI